MLSGSSEDCGKGGRSEGVSGFSLLYSLSSVSRKRQLQMPHPCLSPHGALALLCPLLLLSQDSSVVRAACPWHPQRRARTEEKLGEDLGP